MKNGGAMSNGTAMSNGGMKDTRALNNQALTPLHVLRIACPVFAGLCLAGGLALAGQWIAAIVALLAGAAMLLTLRWPAFWLATGSLVAQVALAVVGIQLNAVPMLMLAGAAAALAGWDLALAAIEHPGEEHASGALDYRHLRLLGITLGGGLVAAALGQFIQFQLPFIVVALLVGVSVWALERVFKGLG